MTSSHRPGPAEDPEAERLQSEIENLRDELGETVDALANKADVKARAEEKMTEARAKAVQVGRSATTAAVQTGDRLRHVAQERVPMATELVERRPGQAGLVVAAVLALVVAVLMMRRRGHRRTDS
jgi:ElaB/YqjD/DUF883 family membrane-anchored ribosome-binding protein